jgi:hypothetical protein
MQHASGNSIPLILLLCFSHTNGVAILKKEVDVITLEDRAKMVKVGVAWPDRRILG